MPPNRFPRFGVPAVSVADAHQDVRRGVHVTLGRATAFPSGVLMASIWDTREDLRRRLWDTMAKPCIGRMPDGR